MQQPKVFVFSFKIRIENFTADIHAYLVSVFDSITNGTLQICDADIKTRDILCNDTELQIIAHPIIEVNDWVIWQYNLSFPFYSDTPCSLYLCRKIVVRESTIQTQYSTGNDSLHVYHRACQCICICIHTMTNLLHLTTFYSSQNPAVFRITWKLSDCGVSSFSFNYIWNTLHTQWFLGAKLVKKIETTNIIRHKIIIAVENRRYLTKIIPTNGIICFFEKLCILLLQTELFFEFTCFSSISKIYNNLSSYSHIWRFGIHRIIKLTGLHENNCTRLPHVFYIVVTLYGKVNWLAYEFRSPKQRSSHLPLADIYF